MNKLFIKLAYFAVLCVITLIIGFFIQGTIDVRNWTSAAHDAAGAALIMGGIVIFSSVGEDD